MTYLYFNSIMMNINSMMNIFYILSMISIECLKFMIHRDRFRCIVNITEKVQQFNIVYVKIFQGICNNSTILSKQEQKYLLKFTDNVPFTENEIDYEVLEYLHSKLSNIDIDMNPINSGVCAIVYRGIYNDNDNDNDKKHICIKILKRGIREKVYSAIKDLELLFTWFDYLPYLCDMNLSMLLKNNKQMFIDQTDFKKEAYSQQLFREKYKNVDWIRIPELLNITEKKCEIADRIIIMEYIEGIKINDLLEEDKAIFGRLIYRFCLSSALFYNAIHADLHSGNLLFIKEKNRENKDQDPELEYKIVLLDFGLCIFPSYENQTIYYELVNDMFIKKCISISIFNPVTIRPMDSHNLDNSLDNSLDNIPFSLKTAIIKEINLEFQKHILNNHFGPDTFINMNFVLRNYGLQYSDEANKILVCLAVASETGKFLSKKWIDIMTEELHKFQKIQQLFEF